MVADSILKFKNVTHGYDNRVVLNNIDLKIKNGEFVTLVGPSGCGKSTLIRLILGAEIPNEGKVFIADSEKNRPNKDCNIVYQKYSIFPHLTVVENVALPKILELTNPLERVTSELLSKFSINTKYIKIHKDILEEANQVLNRIHLTDKDIDNKYPYQLSGGMQQRVAIAQVLIMKPKIILFDEPFSALDLWVRGQLQEYIEEIWEEDKFTCVFVTHDLREAILLGTRLLVLSPYWCDDDRDEKEGSKIVMDIPIPSYSEFMMMDKMMRGVTQEDIENRVQKLGCFDREHKINEKDFVLKHVDCVK